MQPIIAPAVSGSHPDAKSSGLAGASESIQALAILSGRLNYFEDRQRAILDQICHRAAVGYRCGDVTLDDLQDLYYGVREHVRPGWFRHWASAGLPEINRINAELRRRYMYAPNGSDGSWWGEHPISPTAPRPPRGQAVVYLLFDQRGEPLYLGSTGYLRTRLKAHVSAGKEFALWQAWPCHDRESAYRREEEMLRTALPLLNQRAGR